MKASPILAGILLIASGAFPDSGSLAGRIVEQRGNPLRELSGMRVVLVRDYGAIPGDGANDFQAIQSAVAALGNGNAELRFDPGVYEVNPGGNKYKKDESPVLLLRNLENVVVDGQGAFMLIRRPSIGFSEIQNSTNIILRNFTIDYDPLPFLQATVTAIDPSAGWIDVEPDAGFPAPDDPFFSAYDSWGMLKDPRFPGKLKDGAPNVLFRSSCTAAGANRYRIHLTTAFGSFLQTGDRYAQVGRASDGCKFSNSDQVTFENITFYACAGSLFAGSSTSHLNVLHCRGKLHSGRLLVNGADGVHCQAARVGPWVEGCEFEGLSDDCLNVYSIPNHILEVLDDTHMRMSDAGRIQPGDTLAFFRPQTGEVLAETPVVSRTGEVVTLSHAVHDLNTAPAGTAFDRRGWKIYDHAYNLDAAGNFFVYRKNYMHDGRRFGGFIKASYGLIESNRFERLSDSALQIQNEPDWPEGFWARHIVVRGNQMLDCAFLNKQAPVNAGWNQLGHRPAGLSLLGNLFFENNTVRAVAGPAARLNGIGGLTLAGNIFASGSAEGPLVTGTNTTVRRLENNTGENRFAFD